MRHHECGSRREFDREVAIRHRVERVRADAVEAERLRHRVTIDRVARTGECGRAERQAVHAGAAVAHALRVAREHLDVREQVMAERDGLGDLQVREARHDRVGVLFREVEQRAAQVVQQAADAVDLAAQPQADVGRDLVVTRAAGVQALAGVADQRGQARLDVQVDVFQVELPFEFAALDFTLDLRHPAFDRGQVVGADDLLRGEHVRVRERAGDVDEREALVEKYRRRVALDQLGHRFREAGRPASPFCAVGTSWRFFEGRLSGVRRRGIRGF